MFFKRFAGIWAVAGASSGMEGKFSFGNATILYSEFPE
jgi:hypothetical protein